MTPDKDHENEAPSAEFEAFDAMVKRVVSADPEAIKKAVEAEKTKPKKLGRPKKRRLRSDAAE